MKKQSFITILLAVLMSMVGTKAFAHDIEVANSDGVTIYYVWMNNNTELAVSYKGSTYDSYNNEYSGNVVIPSSVEYNGNSYSVTSIGEFAFYDCEDLTSVTIPDGVTSIEHAAFGMCSSLTSVTIPNSVTTLGESAFTFCNSLASIEIPNSVTTIGTYAFFECRGLTSLTIPNSVTKIGDNAFSACIALTSLTISNSMTIIPFSAFDWCTSLTSVEIPNSVTKIKGYAFADCTSLTSIDIPNSVTEIGEGAFYGCTGLTSITIPNSVTHIGDEAFYQVDNSLLDYGDLTAVISLIENPFIIKSTVFTKTTRKNATLYVPKGTKDKYKSTEGWKQFINIVEGTPAGINNFNQEIPTIVRYYDLSGHENAQSRKGINILRMSDGKTKKVFVK